MNTYLFDYTLQLSPTNLYVIHICATTGVGLIVTDRLGQRFTQLCMLWRTDNEGWELRVKKYREVNVSVKNNSRKRMWKKNMFESRKYEQAPSGATRHLNTC